MQQKINDKKNIADSIDEQMMLQEDFKKQRKLIDYDRKVLYDQYLKAQIEDKKNRD